MYFPYLSLPYISILQKEEDSKPIMYNESVKKIIVLCVVLTAVFLLLGKELNPLIPDMFLVHDNTQAARIQEFAFNLKNGIIPPRLTPHFSFQHGLPIFNFYAPFSYWVGALINLMGVPAAIALKSMFFLGLFVSFISFFLFSSLFFGFWGGLLGASVYASSLWTAVEIFVRGNMGEIWFIALFPLGLYFLVKNDREKNRFTFLAACILLSFIFSVHNVLSLVSVFFIIIFSLLLKHKKQAQLAIFIGLLLSSYFLIPAVVENRLTYANEIASKTKYSDHFLCVWQLWKANKWSFGGSGIGCMNDDMSFQIGKIQLILAGIGIVIFFINLKKKIQKPFLSIPLFILSWTLLSAFLTLYVSQPIWDLLSPGMAVFQYPWRFLTFVVFGTAFFASYIVNGISNKKILVIFIIVSSLGVLVISGKFFSRPWKYSLDEYTSNYLTEKYIDQKAAYEIPEYFPRSGDYQTWRQYDKFATGFYNNSLTYVFNQSFYKEIKINQNQIILPIHYFPFWDITIDGKLFIPHSFDKLGRPILSDLSAHSTIIVRYNETPVEKCSDVMTLITLIGLFVVCLNKKIWKKINFILK